MITIEALVITYTVLEVPYYTYSDSINVRQNQGNILIMKDLIAVRESKKLHICFRRTRA